ncbi:peroxisomal biogenesis factor 11 [Pseudovirgaria hyperparasitica]|uniref:Peroxisomal biogenesis factor 11 n=1 Tax=Pseudovirgaria hyperparasitica TaxID=470096 RepID=A0A6A6WE59_9PEZI|nr:peroxisomal biogenesis factor 11 [Pseudovirgaria hyperparasitica]KAF2760344.1 peroxisomal biogenesis factor 11 [Pseudovirgaria hyperparasitica]
MVADAVIYHPSVSHYLRYVATTVGRDKVLRILQYFSRFYAWYLYRTNHPQTSVAPYEAIKKQFGLVRKVMRLGKFVEHFKAAAQAADAKAMDPVLKYCAVGRQLGYAGYMLLDNMTVPDLLNIRKSPKTASIQREAYRMWFAGLSFNIVAGAYTLYNLQQRQKAIDEKTGMDAAENKKIERESKAARLQLVSDLCDITVPTAGLSILTLDDGIVGLAGTTSSLIGAYLIWKKTAA